MASLETNGIIQFVKNTNLPYKVTDINTPKIHSATSYHYAQGTPGPGVDGKGTAVDFAGLTSGDEPEMTAIYKALLPVAPYIAELIHNGPQSAIAVKNGQTGPGAVLFGPVVWAAHQNHVHVAVEKGVILAGPPKQQTPVPPPLLGAPQEVDVNLQSVSLTIPLGDNGKGWTTVPYTIDRIVGALSHSGTRPGADGRYDDVPNSVGFSPEGDHTVVVVQGGQPGGTAPVWLQVIG